MANQKVNDKFSYGPYPVWRVNVLGTNWHNENRGGLQVWLDPNPPDKAYFIARPMDVGLEIFVSMAMTALTNGRQLDVEYWKVSQQPNGQHEGELVSMAIR